MYDRILVPTDGSDRSTDAARYAVSLAEAVGAAVHVLHVVDVRRYSSIGAEMSDGPGGTQRTRLDGRGDRAVGRVRALGEAADVPVVASVVRGVPHDEIVGYAAAEGVDLIAMGTNGRTGLRRALIGSVAERVVRLSPVPVLTLGPDAPAAVDCDDVLVPTDGSDGAEVAAERALDAAEQFGATVRVLSVVDLRSMATTSAGHVLDEDTIDTLRAAGRRAAADVAERARGRGLDATVRVADGVPADVIVRYAAAEGVDLIAMGTHGRTGLRRYLLGSVAETVVRRATAPVLTVPWPEASERRAGAAEEGFDPNPTPNGDAADGRRTTD